MHPRALQTKMWKRLIISCINHSCIILIHVLVGADVTENMIDVALDSCAANSTKDDAVFATAASQGTDNTISNCTT